MKYHFLPWYEGRDGILTRVVFAPFIWVKPEDPPPVCPDCGKLFKKGGEVLGMIPYEGNCLDVHDPDREK
jgi:hypothetical protein